MNELRFVMSNVITAVISFLSPIQDFMTAIVVLFTVNFFCGLTADMVRHADWSWKKAFRFFTHCLVFFGLAAAVFTCGHFMHKEEGAVQCVSYICYVAIYVYSVNILRNMRNVIAESSSMYKVIDITYYVLTLKVVDKIPFLSEYIQSKKGGKTNE